MQTAKIANNSSQKPRSLKCQSQEIARTQTGHPSLWSSATFCWSQWAPRGWQMRAVSGMRPEAETGTGREMDTFSGTDRASGPGYCFSALEFKSKSNTCKHTSIYTICKTYPYTHITRIQTHTHTHLADSTYRVFIWALHSIPLIYVSIFMQVPSCFDYYSFIGQL